MDYSEYIRKAKKEKGESRIKGKREEKQKLIQEINRENNGIEEDVQSALKLNTESSEFKIIHEVIVKYGADFLLRLPMDYSKRSELLDKINDVVDIDNDQSLISFYNAVVLRSIPQDIEKKIISTFNIMYQNKNNVKSFKKEFKSEKFKRQNKETLKLFEEETLVN